MKIRIRCIALKNNRRDDDGYGKRKPALRERALATVLLLLLRTVCSLKP